MLTDRKILRYAKWIDSLQLTLASKPGIFGPKAIQSRLNKLAGFLQAPSKLSPYGELLLPYVKERSEQLQKEFVAKPCIDLPDSEIRTLILLELQEEKGLQALYGLPNTPESQRFLRYLFDRPLITPRVRIACAEILRRFNADIFEHLYTVLSHSANKTERAYTSLLAQGI